MYVQDLDEAIVVEQMQECRDFLLKNGAVIIRDIKDVPIGKNMTARHKDGTIFEYVQMS